MDQKVIYDHGVLWGYARLRQEQNAEITHVELRKVDEEQWKPFSTFVFIEGRVAFRMYGNQTKEGVYDPATNTVTVIGAGGPVRYDTRLRERGDRQDESPAQHPEGEASKGIDTSDR